jgi:hypothetical protein
MAKRLPLGNGWRENPTAKSKSFFIVTARRPLGRVKPAPRRQRGSDASGGMGIQVVMAQLSR